MPVGFKPWDGPRIDGKPAAEDAPPPAPRDERPCLPCDHFEYDQKTEAAAWRLTGQLLNRARARASRRPPRPRTPQEDRSAAGENHDDSTNRSPLYVAKPLQRVEKAHALAIVGDAILNRMLEVARPTSVLRSVAPA